METPLVYGFLWAIAHGGGIRSTWLIIGPNAVAFLSQAGPVNWASDTPSEEGKSPKGLIK
jgi:hypothetical protein